MKSIELKVEEYDKSYTLLIGQNCKENDNLVKTSQPNDLWFHLEDHSGPHFVLKTDGDEIPRKYLKQVAQLFREFKTGLPKRYTVIYTEVKNTKPTKNIGTVVVCNTKKINCVGGVTKGYMVQL